MPGISGSGRRGDSLAEAAAKSAARAIGSSAGRQLVRGVLGAPLGGKQALTFWSVTLGFADLMWGDRTRKNVPRGMQVAPLACKTARSAPAAAERLLGAGSVILWSGLLPEPSRFGRTAKFK